jgi:hypothetical protein
MPSYVLLNLFLAPSRYESKLWSIKRELRHWEPDTPITTYPPLKDLQTRYWGHTSAAFGSFLVTTAVGSCFTETLIDAINWELIRLQPVRYFCTEYRPYGTLAVIAMLGVCANIKIPGPLRRLGVPLLVFNALNIGLVLGNYKPWTLDDFVRRKT